LFFALNIIAGNLTAETGNAKVSL